MAIKLKQCACCHDRMFPEDLVSCECDREVCSKCLVPVYQSATGNKFLGEYVCIICADEMAGAHASAKGPPSWLDLDGSELDFDELKVEVDLDEVDWDFEWGGLDLD